MPAAIDPAIIPSVPNPNILHFFSEYLLLNFTLLKKDINIKIYSTILNISHLFSVKIYFGFDFFLILFMTISDNL